MITIVAMCSRVKLVPLFMRSLHQLIKPANTKIILICDGFGTERVLKNLPIYLLKNVEIVGSCYSTVAVGKAERRQRIADLHNFAKPWIDEESTEILLLEDDTLVKADALQRLQYTKQITGAAFVEGVEISRHNVPYVGAWLDMADGSVVSAMPVKGIKRQKITGGGLYCALVDARLYIEHKFESFNTDNDCGLSCDYNFGKWLTNKGYSCYIDWEVHTQHLLNEYECVDSESATPQQVKFTKDKEYGWEVVRV